VSWETRRKHRYYYRSRRLGGAVQKTYLGRGPIARQAARRDRQARVRREKAREKEREAVRQLQARLAPADELSVELDVVLRILVEATYLARGFHKHRGKWRFKTWSAKPSRIRQESPD
jgi:hypothetical protein